MNHRYTIEADTHCHTIASTHAYGTITENLAIAAQKGLLAIAITDHGPKLMDGAHPWHFLNLRVLPQSVNGITLIRGIEANIMDTRGSLDLEDLYLKNLDWVIASFHKESFQVSTPEVHTEALIQMANNWDVDLMGHLDAPEYPFDIHEVLKACKETGKLIEMNNSSAVIRKGSQEQCRKIALECADLGIPVVVNSDAHCPWDVGEISTIAALLDSISFPEELVFNRKAQNITDHIRNKRHREVT